MCRHRDLVGGVLSAHGDVLLESASLANVGLLHAAALNVPREIGVGLDLLRGVALADEEDGLRALDLDQPLAGVWTKALAAASLSWCISDIPGW